MKYSKIIFALIILIFIASTPTIAETLSGGVTLDWTLVNQQERDKTISYYHDLLFENIQKKIDKNEFSEYKKDKNRDVNRYLIKKNMLSLPDRKLTAFYLYNKILYIYAIRYENNKKNIYYYDAMGTLRYFDKLEKPYDEYPYKAYQYKSNGKLVGVTYYLSEYDQYAFKADGKFYCRWYQDKCYDKKAKLTITRKIFE